MNTASGNTGTAGNLTDILRIASAFVGVIVGAGFASGQEILQFFTSFGLIGLLGGVVSGAVFVFLAMALTSLGQHLSADSHKPVVYSICGRYLGAFVDAFITFFMFGVTVVMLAGAGSLLEQFTGLSSVYGSIAATILTILIVCMNLRNVITLIGAVTPFLVVMAGIVCIWSFFARDLSFGELNTAAQALPQGANQWLIAALLYVSYNIVAGTPMLAIMGGHAPDRRVALWGGVLGGLLLGILIVVIAAGMFARADDLADVPMPTLMLATELSPALGVIMAIVIFVMIINTAVGVLYSFVARFAKPETAGFRWGAVISGVLALLGSFVGFITLVGTVYPFFGYLGFVLIVCTIIGWWRLKAQVPGSGAG